jgi:hypothetical protein
MLALTKRTCSFGLSIGLSKTTVSSAFELCSCSSELWICTAPAFDPEYPEILYYPQEEPDEKILNYLTAKAAIPAIMHRDFRGENEAPFDKFNGLWAGTSVDNNPVSAHMRFRESDEQNAFTGCGKDAVGLFDISGTLAPSDSSSTQLVVAKLVYRGTGEDGHCMGVSRYSRHG